MRPTDSDTPDPHLPGRLPSGLRPQAPFSYPSYLAMTEDLLAQGKTTGGHTSEEMVGYTRLNLHRMRRHDKQDAPSPALREAVRSIRAPQLWWVLTEPWCGDAAQIVPFIAKTAALNPLVDLQLVLRDENLALMDRFLTDGRSRSIPKWVILRPDGLQVLGVWGPRPAPLQALYTQWRSEPGLPFEQVAERLHRWYARDRNRTMDSEFTDLLRGAAAPETMRAHSQSPSPDASR